MEQVRKQHRNSGSDEAIEDLPITDGTDLVERADDLVAEIDSVLEDDSPNGDALILDAAANEKTQIVKASGRGTSAVQSHSARAWSLGGRVD